MLQFHPMSTKQGDVLQLMLLLQTEAAGASADSTWQSVTYGDGKFVAISNVGSNKVMYSTDGN